MPAALAPAFLLRLLLVAGLTLPVAALAPGCGEDAPVAPQGCTTNRDCGLDGVCEEGRCLAPACTDDRDCPGRDVCERGLCVAPPALPVDAGTDPDATPDTGDSADTGADLDADPGTDAQDDAATTEPDSALPDTAVAADADFGPLSYTIDPADEATDVPFDAVIRITFNQPMNVFTLAPVNVVFRQWDGPTWPVALDYDEATFTWTLTPCRVEPDADGCPDRLALLPNTPYEVTLRSFIASRTQQRLVFDQVHRFGTGPAVGVAYHEALARHWAPVIYQEVNQGRLDVFTAIDFDADFDVRNNLQRSRSPNAGVVYWSVRESTTHFFVLYMLYYPGRDGGAAQPAEHDIHGLQVMLRKEVNDPLGRLEAFQTWSDGNLGRWAMETSWYPAGEGVAAPERQSLAGRLPASALEEGRRIPLFSIANTHDLCMRTIGFGRCSPSSGTTAPFAAGRAGLVYRPGDRAQRVGDAANDALTYQLRPFDPLFWALRDRTSGDRALFSGSVSYLAPEIADGVPREGDGRSFPAGLASEAPGGSYGVMPFAWGRRSADPPDQGVIMIDPAWSFNTLFAISGRLTLNYCFNPYLGIDERDRTTGCTRSTFVLPEAGGEDPPSGE
jgi:hypothetical protein